MSFSFRNIFFTDEETTDISSPVAQGIANSGGKSPSRSQGEQEESKSGESGLTYQAYLVSELLPFIPASIAAPCGIPMENEVVIPLPEDGSRDVRLSTLYRLCPELFAIEITPTNDPVVTLPPKLGGMFSAPSPAKRPPLSPPQKMADAPSARPDGVFEWLKESSGTSEMTEAESQSAQRRAQEDPGKFFADNPFDGEEYFKSLLSPESGVDKGHPFPNDSLTEPGDEEPDEVWGAMFKLNEPFQKPFGKKKEEAPATKPNFDGIGNPFQPAAPTTEPTPASIFVPLTELPFPSETETEKTESVLSPLFPSATQLHNCPPESTDNSPVKLAPLPVSPQEMTTPENLWPPLPLLSPEGKKAPREHKTHDLPPLIHQMGNLSANPDPDLRDLELKAIFSTSESFTLTTLARHIVELPGITSCSLTTPEKLVQASRGQEKRIGHDALEMVTTLRSLAKLSGLPDAKTFTIQTDRGIVSLLLEDKCCVTVHHDAPAFHPGVREKLILVARSLIHLDD